MPAALAAFAPHRSVIVLLPRAKALCNDDGYDIDSDRQNQEHCESDDCCRSWNL